MTYERRIGERRGALYDQAAFDLWQGQLDRRVADEDRRRERPTFRRLSESMPELQMIGRPASRPAVDPDLAGAPRGRAESRDEEPRRTEAPVAGASALSRQPAPPGGRAAGAPVTALTT